MKNLLVLLFAFMILAGLQCPNNSDPPIPSALEPTLPAITTKGLNTVGCKIDGKVWVPYSNTVASDPAIVSVVDRNSNWKFGFSGKQRKYSDIARNIIEMSVVKIYSDTIYYLDEYSQLGSFAAFFPTYDEVFFTTNSSNSYLKIIRFDSINQIISGTFSFEVVDSLKTIKHKITDGRFDLRFNY
jgi:hypothetical protein